MNTDGIAVLKISTSFMPLPTAAILMQAAPHNPNIQPTMKSIESRQPDEETLRRLMAEGPKEAWTYVDTSPMATYYGTVDTGIWVPGDEAGSGLHLTATEIRTVVSGWRRARAILDGHTTRRDEMDPWQAVCDEVFRRSLEHYLDCKVSARLAVSAMGALVGEGIIGGHSKIPNIAQLSTLENLVGRECIYGSRGRFCKAIIEKVTVKGGGETNLDIRKTCGLLDNDLPDQLPAGSGLSTFLDLVARGSTQSGWGLFELIIDPNLVNELTTVAKTDISKPDFLRFVRGLRYKRPTPDSIDEA